MVIFRVILSEAKLQSSPGVFRGAARLSISDPSRSTDTEVTGDVSLRST